MEENKVAQITKHPDSSRSTDSGVSGNAQTSESEIRLDHEALRKKLEAIKPWSASLTVPGNTFTTYTISMCRCGLNKDVTDEQCGRCNQLDLLSECSRLASHVQELESDVRRWKDASDANRDEAMKQQDLKLEQKQTAARLASRVERLEIALRECEEVMILMRCNADLREPATKADAVRMGKAMKLAHEALKTNGAGAHAEEK